MGWWSSIFGSDVFDDPLEKLDPKLREFLVKESPVKYATPASPPTPRKDETEGAAAEADKPRVPSASLFPDGRYAHLWKSYRPLAQVEAESATDHDKIATVLDGYKGRKAAIGRAALENCALQQEEWVNCMKHGSWEDQLQMCRHQVRRFERCYAMQSRFLRALGFGSVLDRSPEVDEDIQMHADSLFQRMLAHEAAVEQAKKDGLPIPVFEVVLPQARAASAAAPSPELTKQWKGGLEKLPAEERAVEEAALRADFEAEAQVATSVQEIWKTQKEEREARIAQGQATFFDSVAAFFGRGDR